MEAWDRVEAIMIACGHEATPLQLCGAWLAMETFEETFHADEAGREAVRNMLSRLASDARQRLDKQ